jgi:hypothetical protein
MRKFFFASLFLALMSVNLLHGDTQQGVTGPQGGGGGGGGEANTYSSSGAAGVDIILTKAGVDFPFKSINAASTKLSVVDDVGNNEVDLDIVESNIDHNNLLNYIAGEHTDAQLKLSLNDSTPGYGEDKIIAASTRIGIAILNDGADEDLTIDVNEANVDHDNLLNYVAGEHTDAQLKVSLNDSTPGYVEDKLVPGSTKINIVTLNDGGDEDVSIDVAEANVDHDNLLNFVNGEHTDAQLKVSLNDSTPGYAEDKFVAGSTKVSITTLNEGVDEDISIDVAEANIDHDLLLNYNANDHVDHTAVTLTAGAGLSGTGDISANRTFDVAIVPETTVTAAAGDLILIADVSDANNIKKVTAQTIADLASSMIFGSQFDFDESLGASSTTSLTYIEKLKLTTVAVPAGDYYIGWSLGLSNTNNDKTSGFRVQLDDITTLSEGEVNPKIGGSDETIGGHAVVTLTGAIHDFDIDYKRVDNTAMIRNARLTFWRTQ